MNKYIILLIILLLGILFYFTYRCDRNNIEKFDSNTYYKYLTFLDNNNVYVNKNMTSNLTIRPKTNQNSIIDVDNGIISIGDKLKVDPSNNIFQCGSFNIHENSINGEEVSAVSINGEEVSEINIDPSGNININDFIFDLNKNLRNKDNNIKIDPSNNIVFGNFIYSVTGNIVSKDNKTKIDPSSNITTPEYNYNSFDNSISNTDYSLIVNTNGNAKCNNFDFNKNDGFKIKFGNNNLIANNNRFYEQNNLFSIEPNNSLIMNNNKYTYNIDNDNLSGIIDNSNKFNILNDKLITNNNNFDTNVYNYDNNGSIIYGIKTISIVKEVDNSNNPLHISSVRFYDYNNNLILPSMYTIRPIELRDGVYNSVSTINFEKYYAPNLLSTATNTYGGPRITTDTLFWNKTIGFNNNLPVIANNTVQSFLDRSHNFIGHGLSIYPFLNSTSQPTTIFYPQSYNFTFSNTLPIKYIEIENRKDNNFNRINGSVINVYRNINGLNFLFNTVNCTQGTLIPDSNILSPPNLTLIQPKNKVEKYTAKDYGISTLPSNYDPIVRYYIQ